MEKDKDVLFRFDSVYNSARPGRIRMIYNLKRMVQPVHQPAFSSFALLLLRLVVGTAFVIHGSQKIQNPLGWMGPESPVPGFFQLLAAVSEFGGGIAWILGFLVPLASLGLCFTMMVAVSMHSMVLHDPFVNLNGGRSYELAAAYLCAAVIILAMWPGKLALDAKIFGERS
jgi:putative oxidoreductase